MEARKYRLQREISLQTSGNRILCIGRQQRGLFDDRKYKVSQWT